MNKTAIRINPERLEFSLFGGRLNISFFTIFAFGILIFTDPSLYTLIVFFGIFAHELSHILTNRLCNGKIQKINVYPFGIDIISDIDILPYEKELAVALSGSFANLILATVASLVLGISANSFVCFFIYTNFVLGIGNLIPIPVFDGGIALHIIIRRFLLPDIAYIAENWVDRIAFLLFFIFSLVLCFYTECNLSAVIAVAYTALCAMLREKALNKDC